MAQSHTAPRSAETKPITVEIVPGKTEVNSSEPGVRRYTGNVKLRHQGMILFCDRAIHRLTTNSLSAYGHVLLVQNDSLTVKSDSLHYDGVTRQATLFGHILLQDRKTVLTTAQLNYNLLSGIASYTGKSRFVDGNTILASMEGRYNIHTRQVSAYQQVRLETPRTTVRLDSLHYNPADRLAPETLLARATTASKADLPRSRTRRSAAEQLTTVALNAPIADRSSAQIASTVTSVSLLPDERPVRLTANLKTPQSVTIATAPESVGTYKRIIRVSQRPVQTASAAVEQTPDESDLERLLNRKKQVH